MTLLQDDSVYFPNTPIKPDLDELSSAVRKARITSKTNWFAEPLEASHDGRRADIRSGGLWVELFRALHASRRQAAVRELSKYRHHVQDAQPLDVSSPAPYLSLQLRTAREAGHQGWDWLSYCLPVLS